MLLCMLYFCPEARGGAVFEALRYNLEDCVFDSQ